MHFLNLDGLTAGKDQRALTGASNRMITTAREKGAHWEMPT